MTEVLSNHSEFLNDEDIKDSLIVAYEASDLIGEVLMADVPVMSPATSRYRGILSNAETRYQNAVAKLLADPELQSISEAVHTSRCGCSIDIQSDSCDWHIIGKTSISKNRTILQAGELKVNGIGASDVATKHPDIEGFLDYLEAPKAVRLQSDRYS